MHGDREELTPRQFEVLAAIVRCHLDTAEPVGSKTLVAEFGLRISAATVRHVMNELETMGYLDQPHTSAGRAPTELAYRYFVDRLQEPEGRTGDADDVQRSEVLSRFSDATLDQLEDLFLLTSRLLSHISRHIGVVVSSELRDSVLRRIEIVRLGGAQLLVVLVTQPGLVRHRMFAIEQHVTSQELDAVSSLLNERLAGRRLRDIQGIASESEALCAMFEGRHLPLAVEIARRAFLRGYEEDVYWDGARNLAIQPEFLDGMRAHAVLQALESRESLAELFSGFGGKGTSGDPLVRVLIGTEIAREGMEQCSVIAAPYRLPGHVAGTIGIIGPMRMEYWRLIPLVKWTAHAMSSFGTPQHIGDAGTEG